MDVKWAFCHGFLTALGLVIPIGPQNLYIIEQGAKHSSWRRVLPIILTATASDALMIVLAVTGTSFSMFQLRLVQGLMLTCGISFLIYKGWSQWSTEQETSATTDGNGSTESHIATALAVSVLNPHAILDVFAVIGPSSVRYTGMYRWLFASGCIVTSAFWFSVLAFLAASLRRHVLNKNNLMMRRASAVILWICAAYLMIAIRL